MGATPLDTGTLPATPMLCRQCGHPSRGSSEPTPDVRFDPGRASLDPQESTPHAYPSRYARFRHSGWAPLRTRVLRALHSIQQAVRGIDEVNPPPSYGQRPTPIYYDTHDGSPLPGLPNDVTATLELPPTATATKGPWSPKAIAAFEACGRSAWILASSETPPRYRVAANRCHSRFCIPCQQERGRLIAANIRDKLPRVRLRFMTLTVRAHDQTLRTALDHLYASFTKLRRTRTWKQHVAGGLAILEVNWRPEQNRWHPHFHIIYQGKFFPHESLKQAWLAATGDSWIVDVRAIRTFDDVTAYITKYLSKGIAKGVAHDDRRLCEAITSLTGRKTLLTFGSWAKLALLAKPDDDTTWTAVASADLVISQAADGVPTAIAIASVLWHGRLQTWFKEQPP